MIKLVRLKVECVDCRRSSPELFNLQPLEFIRDLQDLYSWTMVERYDEHYMRCPECTAEIDKEQERRMGPFS